MEAVVVVVVVVAPLLLSLPPFVPPGPVAPVAPVFPLRPTCHNMNHYSANLHTVLFTNRVRSSVSPCELEQTVLDRGSRSNRPRYRTHTRWTLPLLLASAAPRCTPRRASMLLMTLQ